MSSGENGNGGAGNTPSTWPPHGDEHWADRFVRAVRQKKNVFGGLKELDLEYPEAQEVRKQDATFDAAWRGAEGELHAELEARVLERAINGTQEEIVWQGQPTGLYKTSYDHSLAVALLRAYFPNRFNVDKNVVSSESAEERAAAIRSFLENARESIPTRPTDSQ